MDVFECKLCNKQYACKKYLKSHQRTSHRDRNGTETLPYVNMTCLELQREKELAEEFREAFLLDPDHDESCFYVYVLADAELLPSRTAMAAMSKPELVTAIARAIFFVGQGIYESMYQHLQQAMAMIQGRCDHLKGQPDYGLRCSAPCHSRADNGCVAALHRSGVVPLILNTFLCQGEAYARQEILIEHLGVDNVLNDVGGLNRVDTRMTREQRKLLGDGMLWRAMQAYRNGLYTVLTQRSLTPRQLVV